VLSAGLLGLTGLASCSSGPAPGAAGTSCGSTRTGVNVPVTLVVTKGMADCATVRRVEQNYAAAVKAGELTGNGGGAPVRVAGWTCQTYPTTRVLATGDASECHTASAEVVAVLASRPAARASASVAALALSARPESRASIRS
jgi:hypothetical protein